MKGRPGDFMVKTLNGWMVGSEEALKKAVGDFAQHARLAHGRLDRRRALALDPIEFAVVTGENVDRRRAIAHLHRHEIIGPNFVEVLFQRFLDLAFRAHARSCLSATQSGIVTRTTAWRR
jgi:hypothetical protein